jgi:hypothetical protein
MTHTYRVYLVATKMVDVEAEGILDAEWDAAYNACGELGPSWQVMVSESHEVTPPWQPNLLPEGGGL